MTGYEASYEKKYRCYKKILKAIETKNRRQFYIIVQEALVSHKRVEAAKQTEMT